MINRKDVTEIDVTLPQMHAGQLPVFECPARFRVLAKGRRAGGSFLSCVEAIAEMLRGGHCWYIAPTYPNSTERWEELKSLAGQLAGVVIRESERKISFQNGGAVTVKAASVGDSLRGSGLSLILCDEFAYWLEAGVDPKYLWSQVLRPMLAVSQGRALFSSSPNGIDYFEELYRYGASDNLAKLKDWQSFQMPTSANPLVTAEEIAAMRLEMTDLEARQELDAEFVDMTGTVFRRVKENAIAVRQERGIEGHTYVIGVDLAKKQDYSVFAVIDLTASPKSLVYLDRQGHVDYTLQVKRLKALCDRFKPQAVIVEANNVGEAVIEAMQRSRVPNLLPLSTTNATKSAQVDSLAIAFERDEIQIVPDPILLRELGTFIAAKLPSGLMRYAAAGSNHDDTVMALLLAWTAVQGSRLAWSFLGGAREESPEAKKAQLTLAWLESSEPYPELPAGADVIDLEFSR